MAKNDSMDYVKITREVVDGRRGVGVEWSLTTSIKQEDDGRLSCCIPALKIYYTAKDEEAAERKGKGLSKIWIDHYVLHTKGRFKSLVLTLHGLGFKAPQDALVVRDFAHHKVHNAKFKAEGIEIPEGFTEMKNIVHNSQLELA